MIRKFYMKAIAKIAKGRTAKATARILLLIDVISWSVLILILFVVFMLMA